MHKDGFKLRLWLRCKPLYCGKIQANVADAAKIVVLMSLRRPQNHYTVAAIAVEDRNFKLNVEYMISLYAQL